MNSKLLPFRGSAAGRYIIPFLRMCEQLNTYRHIDRREYTRIYALTDIEFDTLVQMAEITVDEEIEKIYKTGSIKA